jgi:hypothetical protein
MAVCPKVGASFRTANLNFPSEPAAYWSKCVGRFRGGVFFEVSDWPPLPPAHANHDEVVARADQMSKTRKSKKAVELIASGYEWTCPLCGDFQREIEAKAKVTCGKCNTEFATEPPEHAFQR